MVPGTQMLPLLEAMGDARPEQDWPRTPERQLKKPLPGTDSVGRRNQLTRQAQVKASQEHRLHRQELQCARSKGARRRETGLPPTGCRRQQPAVGTGPGWPDHFLDKEKTARNTDIKPWAESS